MNETENRQPRKDRRKRATPFFSRYMFWGRRKANRRTAEPLANYYVDRIGFKYWLVVFIIVFLCGIYAIWKLYKLLLIPTRKAKKWVLPDEEKLAIPIEDKEKSRAIGIYFVSLIFSLISFFIN